MPKNRTVYVPACIDSLSLSIILSMGYRVIFLLDSEGGVE